jgi:hypothetical protein
MVARILVQASLDLDVVDVVDEVSVDEVCCLESKKPLRRFA